jgi:hypothetical protein
LRHKEQWHPVKAIKPPGALNLTIKHAYSAHFNPGVKKRNSRFPINADETELVKRALDLSIKSELLPAGGDTGSG